MYVHTLCHTHYTLNQLCFAGNEFGEPVIAERQIRISDIPFRKEDGEEPEDDDNEHEEVELVSPEVRDLLLSFLSLSLCLSISLSHLFSIPTFHVNVRVWYTFACVYLPVCNSYFVFISF